ncbi:MAG TPA: NAD-dependent succinate-semialdehyde dehydrogenase [Pyrinomonadaceae bacterium]|jgi:succinate-semialdehyde dehydrogenase/glutarate-semialdehyde dehydrogenase|nr:NAD-dependent succinate-semialdehyde dehydrogenase [Pyrinomonadaceae bacterium]
MAIATINPATAELLKSFEPLSAALIEEKLGLAAETFRAYRRTPLPARACMLLRVAALLEAEKDRFSRLITTEMGKPVRASAREIEKSARLCRYYAKESAAFLAEECVPTGAHKSYVRYEPIGPVLAVMPWNFPFWQVIRVAAPALMAGNVVLLKHASNVPQCALALEELFRRARFPQGAFQTLLTGSEEVARVIADPRIAAVTLTGSEPAGSSVASCAGKHIKKSVLELGGSDPFIVMPSADVEEASKAAVRARTVNSGQSCVAAKRFIIAEEIYDEFERRFVEGMERLRVGDPLDEATEVGPLATEGALCELDAQVQSLLAAGARLLMGGRRLSRPGFYYAPSVLTEIPRSAPAYREELFGPVALLFRARDLEEAIRLANDTPFGLAASAWTNTETERARFIEEIEAGSVFINGMVASDPRLPFGGVKRSGYGRELGAQGLREYVNAKTIWIENWYPPKVGLSVEEQGWKRGRL